MDLSLQLLSPYSYPDGFRDPLFVLGFVVLLAVGGWVGDLGFALSLMLLCLQHRDRIQDLVWDKQTTLPLLCHSLIQKYDSCV